MKNPFHKKEISPQEAFIRSFLDCIAPGVVKFEVDHYIFGNTYRCVWALREYPASTESQAILRHLGEKSGVTLRIYCRQVSPGEEDRIIDNANKKNKLDGSDPNKLRQAVEAESNLRDVAELVHKMHREHEPLLHCAVYLEMTADSMEYLRQLQTDVLTELVRCKLNVDKLLLRQKQGFYCASPVGYNALGREFERVLPAGSVANLYPFNYSGKTDPNGFYIGKDKYGSNIVVDFDRRDSDKTSANILILGNSGQGKSYLTPVQTSTDAEKNEQQNPLDETPTAVQQPQIAPLQNALTADAVMQLLHHMSRMFRGNMPVIPPALRIDSKRRRRLQEKRMAMGRKWDDHEDEQLHHVNDNTMR